MIIPAILDYGAAVTLIEQNIADKIGALGVQTSLRLQAIKGLEINENTSQMVDFRIIQVTESERFEIRGARTKGLTLSSQSLGENQIKDHEHLRDLDIKFYKNSVPRLLIGQDHSHIITPRESRASTIKEPVASLTPLGLVIHENSVSTRKKQSNCPAVIAQTETLYEKEARDKELNSLVKGSFDIGALRVSMTRKRNAEDERVNQLLSKNTLRIGQRWETR